MNQGQLIVGQPTFQSIIDMVCSH